MREWKKEGQKHEQNKQEEVYVEKETITVKYYKTLEHLTSLKRNLVNEQELGSEIQVYVHCYLFQGNIKTNIILST
jgi:hypothetical protein